MKTAHVKKVKAMLRAIVAHPPFAARSPAAQAHAWDRIRGELWEGATPAFDAQSLFLKLMALPSSSQREFDGWDATMYQLRTRLVLEYARYTTSAGAPPPSPPAETDNTQQRDEVDDDNRDEDEVSLPGSSSHSGDEPYPKRIRIRRDALRDDQDDEGEWMGEVRGTTDPVNDTKLVRAILAENPHATDEDDARWAAIIVRLQKNGYTRKLSAKALKRQLGILLNTLRLTGHDDDPNAELRADLLEHCKSAVVLSPSMVRFVRWATDGPTEPPSGPRLRPTRGQREAAQVPEVTEEPTAAKDDPPARRVAARATPAASVSNDAAYLQLKLAMLDSFNASERHRNEETKKLLGIVEKWEILRGDRSQDMQE